MCAHGSPTMPAQVSPFLRRVPSIHHLLPSPVIESLRQPTPVLRCRQVKLAPLPGGFLPPLPGSRLVERNFHQVASQVIGRFLFFFSLLAAKLGSLGGF